MAQDYFRVEKGLADDNVVYLSGPGAPAGLDATAAPVGSKWSDSVSGGTYSKTPSGWLALATGGDAAALSNEVDTIETSVGLNADGTLSWGGAPSNFLGTDTVKGAVNKIDAAVATNSADIATLNTGLANEVTARTNADTALQNAVDTKISKAGDNVTGNLVFDGASTITGVAEPVNPSDVTTKNYVDNKLAGLTWEAPVDGIGAALPGSGTPGERFINTTDQKIYTYQAGSWGTGETPQDGAAAFDRATETGYVFSGTGWVQFTGGGQLDAGTGLLRTGNRLDINLGAGITETLVFALRLRRR